MGWITSNLKPLVWSVNEIAATINITAESPLHNYTIYPDQYEGGYVIYCFERMTSESGREFFNSSDEAKDWAESTHYPSKMKPYVEPTPTWIDASERLPESECFYLVRLFDVHRDEHVFVILWWNAEHQQFLEWDAMCEPTHWMPIPEFSTMQNNKGE